MPKTEGGGGGDGRPSWPRGQRKQNTNQLIKGSRSAQEVFEQLETLQREGKALDVIHISIAVSALARMRGEWRSAVELLRSSKDRYRVAPNVYTYRCRCPCGNGNAWVGFWFLLFSFIFFPPPVLVIAQGNAVIAYQL